MPSKEPQDELNLLLIAGNRGRAALLRQSLEIAGVTCILRRIDPGRAAVAYARRSGMYERMPRFDVLLVDLGDLDQDTVDTVRSLGKTRASAPLVLLTRTGDEGELSRCGLVNRRRTVFAPTSLEQFLKKMRDHRRRRFLRALDVMNELGPVLVRQSNAMSDRRLPVPETLIA